MRLPDGNFVQIPHRVVQIRRPSGKRNSLYRLKLKKGIPIIDWDTYVKFLARKQGIHPEETPDLTIDEVMVIQLDKDVGRNAIR